jgi:hypothetical protein
MQMSALLHAHACKRLIRSSAAILAVEGLPADGSDRVPDVAATSGHGYMYSRALCLIRLPSTTGTKYVRHTAAKHQTQNVPAHKARLSVGRAMLTKPGHRPYRTDRRRESAPWAALSCASGRQEARQAARRLARCQPYRAPQAGLPARGLNERASGPPLTRSKEGAACWSRGWGSQRPAAAAERSSGSRRRASAVRRASHNTRGNNSTAAPRARPRLAGSTASERAFCRSSAEPDAGEAVLAKAAVYASERAFRQPIGRQKPRKLRTRPPAPEEPEEPLDEEELGGLGGLDEVGGPPPLVVVMTSS